MNEVVTIIGMFLSLVIGLTSIAFTLGNNFRYTGEAKDALSNKRYIYKLTRHCNIARYATERIFGQKFVSVRGFCASFIFSILSFSFCLSMFIFFDYIEDDTIPLLSELFGNDPAIFSNTISGRFQNIVVYIIFPILLISAVFDYISVIQTRYILSKIHITSKYKYILFVFIIDIVFTTIIFIVSAIFIFQIGYYLIVSAIETNEPVIFITECSSKNSMEDCVKLRDSGVNLSDNPIIIHELSRDYYYEQKQGSDKQVVMGSIGVGRNIYSMEKEITSSIVFPDKISGEYIIEMDEGTRARLWREYLKLVNRRFTCADIFDQYIKVIDDDIRTTLLTLYPEDNGDIMELFDIEKGANMWIKDFSRFNNLADLMVIIKDDKRENFDDTLRLVRALNGHLPMCFEKSEILSPQMFWGNLALIGDAITDNFRFAPITLHTAQFEFGVVNKIERIEEVPYFRINEISSYIVKYPIEVFFFTTFFTSIFLWLHVLMIAITEVRLRNVAFLHRAAKWFSDRNVPDWQKPAMLLVLSVLCIAYVIALVLSAGS